MNMDDFPTVLSQVPDFRLEIVGIDDPTVREAKDFSPRIAKRCRIAIFRDACFRPYEALPAHENIIATALSVDTAIKTTIALTTASSRCGR